MGGGAGGLTGGKGKDIPGTKKGVNFLATLKYSPVFRLLFFCCHPYFSSKGQSQRERVGLGGRFLPPDIRGAPYQLPYHTILIYEKR